MVRAAPEVCKLWHEVHELKKEEEDEPRERRQVSIFGCVIDRRAMTSSVFIKLIAAEGPSGSVARQALTDTCASEHPAPSSL
jgi:hypothetical protein